MCISDVLRPSRGADSSLGEQGAKERLASHSIVLASCPSHVDKDLHVLEHIGSLSSLVHRQGLHLAMEPS